MLPGKICSQVCLRSADRSKVTWKVRCRCTVAVATHLRQSKGREGGEGAGSFGLPMMLSGGLGWRERGFQGVRCYSNTGGDQYTFLVGHCWLRSGCPCHLLSCVCDPFCILPPEQTPPPSGSERVTLTGS